MGLRLASTFAITALFALIYAVVFVISITYLPMNMFGLLIIIFITLGIVFLQYLVSPLIIGWIYKIHWIPFDSFYADFPHLAEVIAKVCKDKGIKTPKIGIIYDLNPNAFTYGWSKNTARVVITEGILKYLNKKEQKAVVGHEMGHVIHNDFILMTVVFAIPLVLITIARWCYYTARFSSLGSDREGSNYISIALYAIAFLSYIAYWIGFLISLFVSRLREFYADEYSAEVLEDPNPLATGLVKIAYGLLEQGVEIENRRSSVRALQGLGIMDNKNASRFAATSMIQVGQYSSEAIQAAAAWDLYNPWAKYYQLFSTHPLPARRIQRLNDQCPLYNKAPEIDLSQAKRIKEEQAGKSMIPEFLTDVTIKLLPWLVFFGAIFYTIFWIFGVIGFYANYGLSAATFTKLYPQNFLILFWGIAFFLIGIAVIAKISFMFGKKFK
ncbi:MAG: zinc metalloprotease HtpX, partial [Promethearchaeia archaeon]